MKNIFKILSGSLLALLIMLAGCEDRTDLTAPAPPSTGNANFSSFVTLGNSLTAGYQSGALYKSAQEYSYGNLIAKQVGAKYEQPLISDPGLGGRIEIASLDPFAVATNSNQGAPLNLNYAAPYNNLGVPGALLVHMNATKNTATDPYTNNPLFDVILRSIGTPVQQAKALQASLLTVWIGNNDILGYATTGGTKPYTDTPTFQFLYNALLDSLSDLDAKVLCANVPSVTAIPFFRTVGPGVALAIQPAVDGGLAVGLFYNTNGQMGPADMTSIATPAALLNGDVMLTLASSAYASLIGQPTGKFYRDNGISDPSILGIDTTQAFGLHPLNPFPDAFTLDPAEIATVASQISDFNAAIAATAAAHGFAVVDMNSFFNDVATNGYTANGVNFTTTYVSGGLFSLDGVHPTSQGYAIVANQFIEAINSNFGASIPKIDVSTIPGSLEFAKKIQINEYGYPDAEPGTFDNILY